MVRSWGRGGGRAENDGQGRFCVIRGHAGVVCALYRPPE